MEDVNEYIGNHYPDFGPIAYEDLVGLTEHVQSVFKMLDMMHKFSLYAL
jgi:hypothetical protein